MQIRKMNPANLLHIHRLLRFDHIIVTTQSVFYVPFPGAYQIRMRWSTMHFRTVADIKFDMTSFLPY